MCQSACEPGARVHESPLYPCTNAPEGPQMTGKHITTDQIPKYRRYRGKHNRQKSAAFSRIGITAAWRIDKGIHFRLKPAKPREPRRKKLLAIWTAVALPYIECHPGAPARLVFDHVLSKGPDTGRCVSASQRRSFERWYSRWKSDKGVAPNSKANSVRCWKTTTY